MRTEGDDRAGVFSSALPHCAPTGWITTAVHDVTSLCTDRVRAGVGGEREAELCKSQCMLHPCERKYNH